MLLTALIIILGIIGVFIASFYIISSGKPQKIKDSKGNTISGSISEIKKIKLGDLNQCILIRGEDKTKPLLLFLHGGPGDSEFVFLKKFCPFLEKDFVLVHWDQRGAGKSYSPNIDENTMNINKLVSDGNKLVKFLKEKFKKEKIYLMGHSWGNVLGMRMINEHPENFIAYMGIGQVANIIKGEKISQHFVIEQANKNGNKKVAKKIASYDLGKMSTDEFIKYLMYQRKFVRKYGGAMRNINFSSIFIYVLFAREYTIKDKLSMFKGALFSIKNLWGEIMQNNLDKQILEVSVPVYIFQGKHDYQTPYVVAREYFEKLKAPKKEFFTFENSAHCPLYEENEKFHELIVEKVLNRDKMEN